VGNIERKQFSGNQSEFARELNFALKTAAKMVNHFKQIYIINETMRAENWYSSYLSTMLCISFFDLLVLCMTAYSMRCIPGAMSFSRQGKVIKVHLNELRATYLI
jgi:hypothetical protein